MTDTVNAKEISSVLEPDQILNDQPMRLSALYWIFRKPMETVRRLAKHDHIDRALCLQSLLVYLLPVLFLHLVIMLPAYIDMFSVMDDSQSLAETVVFLVIDVFIKPLLLAGLFLMLYPLLLHRVQLVFGGSATKNEIAVGFVWSLLWIQASLAVVCLFWLFNQALLDEPIINWPVMLAMVFMLCVMTLGVIVHVCMMARVLNLSFASTLFAVSVAATVPLSFVYLLSVLVDERLYSHWSWLQMTLY